MQFKSFKNIVLLLLLATAQPVYPGFFDSIWSGIKGIDSWIKDNKKTSLLIAGTVLGAGILYKYWSRKKTDSSKQQSNVVPSAEQSEIPKNDSIKQQKSSVRSPLLNVFPCFNIEKLHNLGDDFNKDGIPNALWSGELFPLFNITEYLPPLKFPYIATFPHTKNNIYSAAINCDETQILTVSGDSIAYIWDTNGNLLTMLQHTNPVYHAVFNHDGTRILTGSSAAVVLWDMNGNRLVTFRHSNAHSIAFNFDSSRILTASASEICLWSLAGQRITTFPFNNYIRSAEFSPDGNHILIVLDDKTIRILNINNHRYTTLHADADVDEAIFNYDGTLILTRRRKELCLWDITGKQLRVFEKDNNYWIDSIAFNHDGTKIIGGVTIFTRNGIQRATQLWDINGNKIGLIHHDAQVYSAQFNKKNDRVLVAHGRTAHLLDISLLSKKFTPEQAAFIFLCKEHYDKYDQRVLFRAIAKQFAKDGVTRDELIRVLQTFTSSEQQVLINSFNILDVK